MKEVKSVITLLLTLVVIHKTAGQSGDEFNPGGRPVLQVFSNIHNSFSKEGNSTAFEVTRLHLGYEYFFSRTWSARANIDVSDPGTGGLQMAAHVKHAYLQYKTDGFSGRIGMIATDQFNLIDRLWDHRFIVRTFQDEYGLGPSADLGAAVEYSPGDFISFDASVLNGEGYRRIEADSALKYTFGVTFKPLEGLHLRVYTDLMKKEFAQNTISMFAGYTIGDLSTGLEYSFQKNNRMTDEHDYSGIMAFASFKFAEKFNVVARYDRVWSETPAGETSPWNYGRDGQLFLAGFGYSPVKGVRIAPVYKGWLPADDTLPFTSTAGIYLEFRY